VCPHSTVCEAQALSSGEPVEQLQIFQVAGRFDSTRFYKEDSNTHRCQVPNFASEIPGPKLIIKKYGKVNVWCSQCLSPLQHVSVLGRYAGALSAVPVEQKQAGDVVLHGLASSNGSTFETRRTSF
jgi:hypothetical protein